MCYGKLIVMKYKLGSIKLQDLGLRFRGKCLEYTVITNDKEKHNHLQNGNS